MNDLERLSKLIESCSVTHEQEEKHQENERILPAACLSISILKLNCSSSTKLSTKYISAH